MQALRRALRSPRGRRLRLLRRCGRPGGGGTGLATRETRRPAWMHQVSGAGEGVWRRNPKHGRGRGEDPTPEKGDKKSALRSQLFPLTSMF